MNNITKRPLDAPTTINPPTKKPKLDDFSGAGGRSYAEGALVDGPNPGLLKRQHIEDLKEKGYTVVEGVMSAQDCTNIQQAWLATMGSYEGTGFKANDRSTWKGNNLPANIRGMQNWPPVAQEWWVWETRLRTAPVFAALWGTKQENLISSMDRVCFVPNDRLKLNKGNEQGWPHLDQAQVNRRGTLECVQGFVTLNDIGEGEVSLQVYEGAHKHHKRFFTERVAKDQKRWEGCYSTDWCKLDAEGQDRAWYMNQTGVKEVRVHAKAGSLVLWDSRLPHHAMPPKENAKRSKVDRFVIYSCMVPRRWANSTALEKRMKAHEKGLATPHWPHDGKTFPYKPRTYSKDTPLIDPTFNPVERQLNPLPNKVSNYALVRRLVGYDE